MFSAVIVPPPKWPAFPHSETRTDENGAQATVARSLPWLVTAAIRGILRDLTLIGAPQDHLGALASQTGCDLVVNEDAPTAFRGGLANARCDLLLILIAGFEPISDLNEELDRTLIQASATPRRLQMQPRSPLLALVPGFAPAIGLLANRSDCEGVSSFAELRHRLRKARPLATRMRPLS